MAGWLNLKGSESSFTEASPEASRARMARRVGSAKAEKVSFKRSGDIISPISYIANYLYKTKRRRSTALRVLRRRANSGSFSRMSRAHLPAAEAQAAGETARVRIKYETWLQFFHAETPTPFRVPMPPDSPCNWPARLS